MKFTAFLNTINHIQSAKIGGLESQFRLAPKMRLNYNAEKIAASNPKRAAVLALFYPNKNGETCFLLTERASYKGTHSAQISFPGGKIEKSDKNLKETALRETFEEVGVLKERITVLREITDVYIPPSNFLATPFIAYTEEKPVFNTNHEVEQTFDVLLKDLLDDANITSINITTSYAKNIDVPCFKLNNYIVWGATAMILNEIKELLK
ncbi:putative Nudix hydrolase NudL [Polaribacter huanghezhanensis]|uniref:NUDIX hydrolase n=1 Tax=Polaribacter huanghezhanensis TaxID=1354726 RepID=UPI002647ADBB|nr:CoA pyrophosphatase [Polaribacter huanghezhanensis]WKD86455.1 putative Nudix hydrolase NudL [Polaribacter huanghezhanensis]